jgi:dihydroneopterin aldolase
MSNSRIVPFPRLADEAAGVRHVFVRDLVVPARIGVWNSEKGGSQRVRINLDLAVAESEKPSHDRLDEVVCYNTITTKVRALAAEAHTNLIETLAERIAEVCLQDRRVVTARVRVEKLDVYEDAASVGVEIERRQHN